MVLIDVRVIRSRTSITSKDIYPPPQPSVLTLSVSADFSQKTIPPVSSDIGDMATGPSMSTLPLYDMPIKKVKPH